MIRTVKFDDLDSFEDFGLVRVGTSIDAPSAKTSTVEVEGMDGVLDFSEYFGELMYDDRGLSFDFQSDADMSGHAALYASICNALDGRKAKITLSEDPGFYWLGRVSVGDYESAGRIFEVSIEADCEPYRYKAEPTTKTVTVSGSKTETFSNLRKRVRPTFDLSAEMTIRQGAKSFTASGTGWSDPALYFGQGANDLTFEGTGTVKVTWQEKGL